MGFLLRRGVSCRNFSFRLFNVGLHSDAVASNTRRIYID